MNPLDDSRIEAVGMFLTRVDADIACGALVADGIDAFVAADDAAGTRPHLWMGGVRLVVRAEDADRARALLRDLEQAEPAEDAPAGPADLEE
jgi:hypothetical protein